MSRLLQRGRSRVAVNWWATPETAVAAAGGSEVVLVAHSAACALVAFWAATTSRAVRGALLVSPSDTEAASWPQGPVGWQPMPLAPLRFPSIVVASSDDEFVTLDRARAFAEAWGSRFVPIGAAGTSTRSAAWDRKVPLHERPTYPGSHWGHRHAYE